MNDTCNGNLSNSIVTGVVFQLSSVVTFILSLISVGGNAILLLCFTKLTASHRNIRILSCNLSFACILGSGYYIWRCVHLWFNSCSVCELHMTSHYCSLTSLPARIASTSSMCTMVGIAVERFIATVNHQTYNSRSRKLPIFIVLWSWLLYPTLLPVVFFHSPRLKETPFCIPLIVENYNMTMLGTALLAIVGIITILAYLRLIVINRRRLREFATQQVHLSLSSRMEMRQNIELTQLYLPSLCVHTGFWVNFGLLTPVILYGISDDRQELKMNIGVNMNNLYCAFMAIHPFLLFWRSERLRFKLKMFLYRLPLAVQLLQKTRRRVSPPFETRRNVGEEIFTVQEHFNHLQRYWLPPRITQNIKSAYTVSKTS